MTDALLVKPCKTKTSGAPVVKSAGRSRISAFDATKFEGLFGLGSSSKPNAKDEAFPKR